MLMFLPFFVLALPIGHVRAETLADFSRFAIALNQTVSLVDSKGREREGLLVAATEDNVTIRVGAFEETFARVNVISAERHRDGSLDGAIKGALFGLAFIAASQFADGHRQASFREWVSFPAVYSVIGFGLDLAIDGREPLYRAPSPPLKVSLRF